jgi:hypothetical protein
MLVVPVSRLAMFSVRKRGGLRYHAGSMNRTLPVGLATLLLTGCVSAPPRDEKQSPKLAPTQVSELRKQAKSADQLGIKIVSRPPQLGITGINEVSLAQPAAVPLVELPTSTGDEPSARYRLPCILATVNGREGQRVLLDSGSNRVLLGYSLAHSLDIPLIAGLDPVPAQGIGGQGQVDGYWAIVPQMSIGALELRRLLTLVGPDAEALTYRRSFWGNMQVMILGVNGLRGLTYVSIDYLRGKVAFGSGDKYLPDAAAAFVTAVPLRWEGDLPVVDAVLERRYRTPCVVDTGGDYGLLLPRVVATELGYWKPGWGSADTSRGIAGEAEGKGYLVHEVKIGDAVFRQVAARSRIEGPEPLGGRVLVGNYELRRYRVTFDFKNHVLWLEK